MKTLPADLGKITRLTVVDDNGRAYEQWEINVTASVQDGGRTLKLFVTKFGSDKYMRDRGYRPATEQEIKENQKFTGWPPGPERKQ